MSITDRSSTSATARTSAEGAPVGPGSLLWAIAGDPRSLIPGTAGFFKWDPEGPKLSLHGNVFRADQPASTVGLAIPEDKLADCSGNIMVWLGRGDYPEKLPPCFTVTKDVRIWQAAVQRWKEEYGNR